MPYFGTSPDSRNVGAYNYLINGDMTVSQRGTSFVAGANNDDVYTLDQWILLSESNDGVDVTQQQQSRAAGRLNLWA